MRLKQFLKDERGVATVDWVVIASGATAMGVIALGVTQTEMGEYSWSLRDNLQATSFDATWADHLTLNGERIDIRDLGTGIVPPPPPPPPPQNPAVTAGPIAVVNAGFESRNIRDGDWNTSAPGWTVTSNGAGYGGDYNPKSRDIRTSTVTGSNVGYLFHENGSNPISMSQITTTAYSAAGIYDFTVAIGDTDFGYSGNEPYILNIYAGTTLIGTRSGTTGDIDELRDVTVTSTVANPALNGQPIRFEIVNPAGHGGGEIVFDNVRGTARASTSSPPSPPPPSPSVAGCPSTAFFGVPIVSNGSDFGNSNDYLLQTTGHTNIQSCSGLPSNRGFFDANPSFTLTLSNMQQFNAVQFLIESSTCDTTLLIRDASGTYHFNDDFDSGHYRSRLILNNTINLNGRVDVWIGGYDAGSCTSTLEIRNVN